MQNDGLLILVTLAIIIFLSPHFSRLFRIPIAPMEIILGTLAAFFGLITHNEIFSIVSEAGFLFLMFLAGLEVDLRIFLDADRKSLKKGLIYIAILYALSFVVTVSYGLDLLFTIIIPIMAVGMIFTLFKEHGKDHDWLNLAMLIGVIGEVVSITLLTIVSAYLKFGMGIDFWLSIGYLVGFLALSGLVFKILGVLFWWFPSLKVMLMPHYDKNEKDIRLSFAALIMLVALMIFLHLEIVLGAFMAGMIITTFFDHKKDLPQKLGSFGLGFMVPIFFVHIGSTLKLETILVGSVLSDAMFIVCSMIGCRFMASFVFLKVLKFKGIVLYSLSHSMPLTLLIAVATIAHKSGSITDSFYSSFIVASLTEVLICMTAIKIILNFKQRKVHEK